MLGLFNCPAHSGDEIALEEQKHQHDRDYRNEDRGGKLVVLRGKLCAELNESKWQRP
jgi:hypothetical protein